MPSPHPWCPTSEATMPCSSKARRLPGTAWQRGTRSPSQCIADESTRYSWAENVSGGLSRAAYHAVYHQMFPLRVPCWEDYVVMRRWVFMAACKGLALLATPCIFPTIRGVSALSLRALPGGGVTAGGDTPGRRGDSSAASDGPTYPTHLQRSRTRPTPLLIPTTELYLP